MRVAQQQQLWVRQSTTTPPLWMKNMPEPSLTHKFQHLIVISISRATLLFTLSVRPSASTSTTTTTPPLWMKNMPQPSHTQPFQHLIVIFISIATL